MRWTCPVLVCVALVIPTVAAQDGWTASFLTAGPLEIGAAAGAEVGPFALATRQYDDRLDPRLRLTVSTVELSVLEIEAAWTETDTDPLPDTVDEPIKKEPVASPRWLRNATLELVAGNEGGATALTAEKATLSAFSNLRIRGVAERPYLATDKAAPSTTVEPHEHERHAWQLPGTYLSAQPQRIEGHLHGAFALYVFGENFRVRHDGGNESFQANVSESNAQLGTVKVVEARWFLITANETAGSFWTHAATGSALQTYTRTAVVHNASSVAVDSIDARTARLPVKTSETIDSSAWINGDMEIRLEAREDGSSYRVAMAGSPTHFSLGGGVIQPFSQPVLATTAILAATSVVAALLWRVLGTPLAVLFSRVTGDAVMNSTWRSRIVETLAAQPGQSYTELRTSLAGERGARSLGVLTYHLSVLERHKLIRSARIGRFRRYFRAPDFNDERTRAEMVRVSPTRELFHLIVSKPRMAQKELLESARPALGLKRTTLAYHLDRMARQGLIVAERQGRQRRYAPADTILAATFKPADAQAPPAAMVVAAPPVLN